MSKKSGKRKSSKGSSTGTTLGAVALIISLGARGLGRYQFIAPPATEEPQFYILEHDDFIYLDEYSSVETVDELNITYNTEIGDTVVLEFSCQLFLQVSGTTTLRLNFDNNGTYILTGIYASSDMNAISSEYMKYTFKAETAGENNVVIIASCTEEVNNWLRYCLLTVTVYG